MTALPLHLQVRTDTGRLREQNEDSVGHLTLSDGQLVVVADGMGGHQAGDVASQITIREVIAHVEGTVGDDPRERLYVAIEQAHTAVRAHATTAGTLDMGCTVVACFVQDGVAHVAHVGDSRLYLIRQGRVSWVTKDHTRVRFLVDAGLLSEADAEDHPESNVITRAVGHDPADIDGGFVVDVRNVPIQLLDGDSLLLCSDGLYDMVPDHEILSLLADRCTKDAVDLLIDRANEADRFGNEPGGYDNITVALVQLGEDRGSVASCLDDETLNMAAESVAVLRDIPRVPAKAQAAPEGYRPQRSTLVPDPTLDDVAMTLPDEGTDSPEPGIGTGTGELKATRRPAPPNPALTPTLEVGKLRQGTTGLVLLALVVLATLVWVGTRYLGTPSALPSPDAPSSSPTPGEDE